ncbi:MAG: hypothetical protein IT368_02775, partial [Candidatus Hydrogenedentes bacterium]|nr:hypothetical protein [Candidatus Hydrogenedentota bacterium]
MTKPNAHRPVLAIALAAILATPAFGQHEPARRHGASGESLGSPIHARPAGWVRIGYDTDQDGRFEAVEYIYAFDLDQARERSRQRHAAQRRGSPTDPHAEGAAQDQPRTRRARAPQQRDRLRAMRDQERRDLNRALRAQAWREHMRRHRTDAHKWQRARQGNDAIRRDAPIPGDALRRVNGQILQTHT